MIKRLWEKVALELHGEITEETLDKVRDEVDRRIDRLVAQIEREGNMSEFVCSNGHIMPGSRRKCPECGAGVKWMDGMTGPQMTKEAEGLDYEPEEVRACAEAEGE